MAAKFDAQGDDWTANVWSLVIQNKTTLDAPGVQEVHVLLRTDAPSS